MRLMDRSAALRNFKFKDVHVDGAQRIATVAREAGVPRFIHVSSLNASPDSTSRFYKTKWEGEQKVKEAYPDVTIIRPAAMYGYEDRFLNNMASKAEVQKLYFKCANEIMLVWPIWWRLNDSKTRVRPVHVSY